MVFPITRYSVKDYRWRLKHYLLQNGWNSCSYTYILKSRTGFAFKSVMTNKIWNNTIVNYYIKKQEVLPSSACADLWHWPLMANLGWWSTSVSLVLLLHMHVCMKTLFCSKEKITNTIDKHRHICAKGYLWINERDYHLRTDEGWLKNGGIYKLYTTK